MEHPRPCWVVTRIPSTHSRKAYPRLHQFYVNDKCFIFGEPWLSLHVLSCDSDLIQRPHRLEGQRRFVWNFRCHIEPGAQQKSY